MNVTKEVIRCFIASPSDTTEERAICEKVFAQINEGLGVAYNLILESLKWEKDVHPGIGEDAQAVINGQINNKFDIFIGIMNTRLGTATSRAESGTVEEFENAYARLQKYHDIEIMFYFNDAPMRLSGVDIEQYLKVKEFRENVVAPKGLYSLYDGVSDFEVRLKKDLTNYLNEHYAHKVPQLINQRQGVKLILENRLKEALKLFDGQPQIWIEPTISFKADVPRSPNENEQGKVEIDTIIDNPNSIIISAPPQFGLTCLSHYLVLKAWEKGKNWIYINSRQLRFSDIDKQIKRYISELNLSEVTDVECLVLDEWNSAEDGAVKKLKAISDKFKDTPIVLMRTIDGVKFLKEKQEDIRIDRHFTTYFLLPLNRTQIRHVVSKYNQSIQISDDESLLKKLVSDISTLNIPRTPQNCLTLLKVDEKKFDNNPVNRCQMLEDVLYVLFEFSELPKYNSKPDVKDCQFILGCFCEMLIRENRFTFTYSEFLSKSKEFSVANLIEIEVKSLIDILCSNNIIIGKESELSFKSAFWIMYFVARRMNSNSDFAEYIFKSKRYLDYPEIIEFYTGIDRNRTDALDVLMTDLKATCDTVYARLSIPDNFNPYRFAKWNPTAAQIERMQQELSQTMLSSGLPVTIKDKYQDEDYNQIAPYNQNVVIHDFFEEYYVYNLIQEIKSSSRALRNSDYANAKIKKELLKQILHAWLQISKVLFALIPVLASEGRAEYGGAGFLLSDGFGETVEERAKNILFYILTNVVGFFKDDLYSSKIAPLLYDAFEHPATPLIKQHIALLLIICRPNKWYNYIDKYIISLPKDSFFMYEVLNEIRAQYAFGFLEEADIKAMPNLIKKCLAKHSLGVNNPSCGHIKRVPSSCIPKRTEENN